MSTAPPPPQSSSSGVRPETVERAVKALLKWRSSKSNVQKPQLLEQDEFFYLVLTLKKIPQKGVSRINAHKIPLPHPLTNAMTDSPELCLIVDDRPKSGLTKEAAKKKIEKESIPISKIIKVSKLRTDYRPFEAKRKLCDSYDMFFADKRVVPLLPKMLGKQFFKKKKIPVTVDLKHQNWKEQIERACGSALLFLRTGTCSVVKVGKVSMSRDEITNNVVAAINGIAEIVPRKWGGIRSFHLKLFESLALPVYQAVPDLKLKIEGASKGEEKEGEAVVEEKTAKEEKVGKKKGRIHEARYMDTGDNEDDGIFDEDELGSEVDGDIDEDDCAGMGSGELVSKKRKKVDNKEKYAKREKKVAKMKREEGVEPKKLKNEDGVKQKKQKKDALSLKSDELQVKEEGEKKKKKKKRLAAQ